MSVFSQHLVVAGYSPNQVSQANITDVTTWRRHIVLSWLRLAVGAPVGLWGLQVVREQDLYREADSFSLKDAVSVVESQDIWEQTHGSQYFLYCRVGYREIDARHKSFCW